MQLTSMPRSRMKSFRAPILAFCAGLQLYNTAPDAMAEGQFSPAIQVNDEVVTWFELDQRAQFLTLLRAPGNPEKLAREALIEDRLKNQAVKEAGITIASEDIDAGIEELAGRTQLSAEEFVQALEQGGVAVETLRDFTKIGLAWRELIRSKYIAQSRPTELEIDRALGRSGGGGGIRVLLSEIIIPVTPQTLEQVDNLAMQLAEIESISAFSEAAEKYSATDTRTRGGRMEWLAINNLPPGLRPLILALNPGEITDPISLPDAVALFQMRDIQESGVTQERFSAIEYAIYYIPGGRSPEALASAARISEQIDTCDDLYGIAQNQPAEQLERISLKPAEIPRDIGLELAKLDQYEISTALTRSNGQTLMLLMMCGRTAELNEDASREEVAQALVQQRLTAFAQSYLDQLRADALIIEN